MATSRSTPRPVKKEKPAGTEKRVDAKTRRVVSKKPASPPRKAAPPKR